MEVAGKSTIAPAQVGVPRSKRPVFIVGFPRSGTTLLYDMLLSAGGFAVYLTETHFFTTFVPRFGDQRVRRNREALLNEWLGSDYFKLSGLRPDDIRQPILEGCANAGDFLRVIMDSIARTQNMRRWAEKTPDHVLHLRQIKRLIPEALIIHIIRDGRDACLSMEKLPWVRPLPWDRKHKLTVCGVYWEWMVKRGLKAAVHMSPDYLQVRFEDLIERPQLTLDRIGEFIGQQLDFGRIRETALGSLARPNTSFTGAAEQAAFNPVRRWKQDFPPVQLAAFETLFGPLLEDLGYPLSVPRQERRATVNERRIRAFYRAYFALRLWVKTRCLPLSRHVVGSRAQDIMRWSNNHNNDR